MKITLRILAAQILLTIIVLSSCKCNKKDDDNDDIVSTQVMKDAIAHTQNVYLWADQLPVNIDAAQFKNLDELMAYTRNYSQEPGFTNPVDRWSFAIKKSEWDDISEGIAGDFGINVFFRNATDLRVRIVEKASPAGFAGIKRGWQIIKINNHTSITTSDADIDYISNAIYKDRTVTITFKKPDNSTVEIPLQAASYVEEPVLLDTVYNEASGKVGYVVVNSFLGNETTTEKKYETVFSKFAAAGIKDLIIDLRYNGGGYVSYQRLLANYLVPAAGDNQVMMKELNNTKNERLNTVVKFAKKGSLNLNRVYFLITGLTASASELVINNLKPYMSNGIKLIGTKTEGKPVGYYGRAFGNYYIFPVSFRSLNGANEGNYFNGMQPDALKVDSLTKDWGDRTENLLQAALAGINNGGVLMTTPNRAVVTDLYWYKNQQLLSPRRFSGAVKMEQ